MNDELEQFEPARPRRRRRRSPNALLSAGLTFLIAGFGWSACVAALWSPAPEAMADNGLTIVGCCLASIVCYILGLASLVAWKNRRR
jgi:hypothetical protein